MAQLYRLIDNIKSNKQKLNAIEASMALSTIYNSTTRTSSIDKRVAEVYMDVLAREEDDYSGFDILPDILDTYHYTNVYKYTGLTLNEYLTLPIGIRDRITKQTREYTKQDKKIEGSTYGED